MFNISNLIETLDQNDSTIDLKGKLTLITIALVFYFV